MNKITIFPLLLIALQVEVAVVPIVLAIFHSSSGNVLLTAGSGASLHVPHVFTAANHIHTGLWFGVNLLISSATAAFSLRFQQQWFVKLCVIVHILISIISQAAFNMYVDSLYNDAAVYKLVTAADNNPESALEHWRFLQAEDAVGTVCSLLGFFITVFHICSLFKNNFSLHQCCQCCASKTQIDESSQLMSTFELSALKHPGVFLVTGVLQLLLLLIIELIIVFSEGSENLENPFQIGTVLLVFPVGVLSLFVGKTGQRGLLVGTAVMTIIGASYSFGMLLLELSVLVVWRMRMRTVFVVLHLTVFVLQGVMFGSLILQIVCCCRNLCSCCCCCEPADAGGDTPAVVFDPEQNQVYMEDHARY